MAANESGAVVVTGASTGIGRAIALLLDAAGYRVFAGVRKGDTVITSGGLVGKITKVVDDDQIEVELAEGVRVRQMRAMVTDVRAKGEPVKDDDSKS